MNFKSLLLISVIFSQALFLPRVSSKTHPINNAVQLEIVGEEARVNLFIKEASQVVDTQNPQAIRLAVRTKKLFNAGDTFGKLTVKMYDEINGERVFVSEESVTTRNRNVVKSLFINPGDFVTSTKDVIFELYDDDNVLAGTYRATLTAGNFDGTTASVEKIANADCDNSNFGECQLDYLMENINFVSIPRSQARMRVNKNSDGTYNVLVPAPRRRISTLGRTTINRIVTNTESTISTANGGTISSSGFGNSLSISEIILGQNAGNFGTITYGAGDSTININAANGTSFTGGLKLNAEALDSVPENGKFEFDGNSLYFTAGGSRQKLSFGTGTTVVNETIQIEGDQVDVTNIQETEITELTVNSVQYGSSTVNLTGPSTAIANDTALIRLNNTTNGALAITANPQILAGVDGQQIILKGLDDSAPVLLNEGNGLSLAQGAQVILGRRDNITFIYDSEDSIWMEVSRVNN